MVAPHFFHDLSGQPLCPGVTLGKKREGGQLGFLPQSALVPSFSLVVPVGIAVTPKYNSVFFPTDCVIAAGPMGTFPAENIQQNISNSEQTHTHTSGLRAHMHRFAAPLLPLAAFGIFV